MSDFVTPNKGLTEPTVGQDNNSWGTILNTDFSLIDSALGGTVSIAISSTTTLITSTQAENGGYEFTGSLSATNTITWPAFFGDAFVYNNTSGGHPIVCTLGSGTTVAVAPGEQIGIWSDGTNFYRTALTGGGTGGISLASGYSLGSVNKLRGNSLSQWYSGTSITITTSGGWASEGVYVLPTGASVTASQVTNPSSGAPYWALKILGASSNTDVKVRFPIESYDAAILAGQTCTFQLTFQNKSGASITPTLATKYPSAQDNYTSSSTDLSATNMQAVSNNATGTVSYTWTVSASANNGYTLTVDFGVLGNTDYIEIVSFDFRVTPGIATGINSSPPVPEISHPSDDAEWCQRFFQSSYPNGTAPGTVNTGIGLLFTAASTAHVNYVVLPTPLRASPTLSFYSVGSGTSGQIYCRTTSSDVTGSAGFQSQNNFELGASASFTAGDNYQFQYIVDARITGA